MESQTQSNKDQLQSVMSRSEYQSELSRLQGELATMLDWIIRGKKKVVVIFEGRDASGKGSCIKRLTEFLQPRHCRVVALPPPTERERTQWYFQRYIEHLPAGGELVIYDRSWYNRAVVENVMGYCTPREYEEFMQAVPFFERMLIQGGIQLVKYWFSVSDEVQEKRFLARLNQKRKSWKLSANDLEARMRWVEYSKAKDVMLDRTSTLEAPWYVVDGDVKFLARLNCISHLLNKIDYQIVESNPVQLPERPKHADYVRPPFETQNLVPATYG